MSPPSPNQLREATWAALAQGPYDLLVIGGGITGCGIARDAALRGLRVALVEKEDFAAGTSSRSSKLIHGGLRYLEHAQFRLVFEGTNERGLLMQLAPHLVKPLPFMVPAYRDSRAGLLKLDVGLWIYDALCGFHVPKLHRTYRAGKVHELEPALLTDQLKGGIVYYDALTDDARLTLENAQDARSLGAVVLNYARVCGLVRSGGRVTGAQVQDTEPLAGGRKVEVRARVVVNATGPWTDEVRALGGEPPILAPTRGVHLVVDAKRATVHHAIVMLARGDHRVMFAIPWGNRLVLGTTDTFYEGSPDAVHATKEDVDYVLETANHYFPHARLTPQDVLSTWAGLRPLIRPSSGLADASDVSREHHVIDQPGLVTIAGGKLTTYRRIAAEVVDVASRQLGSSTPSTTSERSLPGSVGLASQEEVLDLAEHLVMRGVEQRRAVHLANTYGVRAVDVVARAHKDPSGAEPLDAELPYLAAEVDEAVDAGMARTLVDVLGRRVPLMLKGRDQGLAVAPVVAARMAKALDWTQERQRDEVSRYAEAVQQTRRFRA